MYFPLFELRNVFDGYLFKGNLVQVESRKCIIMTIINVIKCFARIFGLCTKNIKICPKICSNSVFCFLRKMFLVEDTEH